jgi:hypothetical protein
MSDVNWFPHTSQKIVNALRFGGYASFIPSVIQPVWDDVHAPLAGLPISICFTGLRMDGDRDAGYVASCYWFDPQTFSEDEECQSMTYRSRYASEYRVVLVYSKQKGCWEGRKMRGDEVVVTAHGIDLTRFVIQMTMRGLHDGEHVEPMLTRTDTASTGIWVFEPEMAELARTGRLQ